MSLPKGQVAKAQLEALQREVSRRRLMPFIKRFNPKYKDGWVHNDICRRLERFSRAVAEQEPSADDPHAAAARKVGVITHPATFLRGTIDQHPDHEFIACSYNLSLAMDL